ncbi:hypothetical protein AeRB84_007566, partial [Aphanomyces euteiches]
MSSQPTSSIEERLVAAADHLDGLVAKISPVQRDVRNVLKQFREFKGSHVKKEDHDQLRSDYEKVLKEKREQERQGVKKEDYERLRSEYKASEKDREKRAEEIRALKLEANAKDQVDRLRSERNGAKEESKRLPSDPLTFGHRFLNWALKNHTIINLDSADFAVRAWLNDEGLLSDVRSRDAWAATNGFTMNPGEPDDSVKLFALPAASPPTDPSGGGSTPKRDESRQDRSASSGGKSAQPSAKGNVKNTPKSSDKVAGSGQEPRTRSDRDSPKTAQTTPGPDQSQKKKGQENPSRSIRKPKAAEGNRDGKAKPASGVKLPDKGKKRMAPAPVDTSKRPCPSGPPTPPRGPLSHEELTKELFGTSDDDVEMENPAVQESDRAEAGEARNPAEAEKSKDTADEKKAGGADPAGINTVEEKKPPKSRPAKGVSKHQTLVELHRDICQSRPWRRYLCTAGHFLPEVGEVAFEHPDHAISVSQFRSEMTRFWESCGEEVWKRMFQLTDKADGKAWERIVYQATHLVVELQILIDHSDFDDDLIRFLCFPHPAWPQLFHKPIALSDISGLVSPEAAIEYLSSEYSKYWPKVPNMRPDRKSRSWSYALGSTFAVVAKKKPGSSQVKALARRLFNVYDRTGEFKYDPDTDFDRVTQVLTRINEVAQEFVKNGAKFEPDRRFPLV